MLAWTRLYERYFEGIRKRYTKKPLMETTIIKRMKKVIKSLPEIDQHYLYLYGTYGDLHHVATMNDVAYTVATRRVHIALCHLITPRNVQEITGCTLFKHSGKSLKMYSTVLSGRTINALKRQDIETIDDLRAWLSQGIIFLYRVPGVGKWGVLEILTLLTKLGSIKVNV